MDKFPVTMRFVVLAVLALLVYFILFATPSKAAEVQPFKWLEIGVAPYNIDGKTELDLAAVDEFVAKGELTKAEGEEFKTLVKTGKFEKSTLTRGRVCRAMLSKNKKLDKPVELAWKHFKTVDAKLYKLAAGLELYLVERCGNPLVCDPLPVKVEVPAPSPTTPVVFKAPEEKFTNRIMVWEILGTQAEKEAFLKNELKGKQSRALGNVIEEGLETGRLALCQPRPGEKNPVFQVEFHDFYWGIAKGSKLGINNKYQFGPGQLVIPKNFGTNNNTLEVEVVDGESQVTLEKKIFLPGTSVTIRAPDGLHVVHPANKTLHTCIEHRTKTKCGGV